MCEGREKGIGGVERLRESLLLHFFVEESKEKQIYSPSIHRRPLPVPLRRHARLLAIVLRRRHLPSVPCRGRGSSVIARAGGRRVLLRPGGVLGSSWVAVPEASLGLG